MTTVQNQYRIRQTVLEMLHDRGFNIFEYEMKNFNEFQEKFPNCLKETAALRIHVSKTNEKNEEDSILVFFAEEDRMSLKSTKLLLENSVKQNLKNLIMVLREGISPPASKYAMDFTSLNITIFKEKELLFNITKHKLVSKHRIISQEEKEKILKEKLLKEEHMPKILITDPVAKYLGAKKGDVLEIERESETAGMVLFWRIAI